MDGFNWPWCCRQQGQKPCSYSRDELCRLVEELACALRKMLHEPGRESREMARAALTAAGVKV